MDDEPIKLEELESELRGLIKGQFSSLTLSFNDDSGPNYSSVKDWIDRGPEDAGADYVSAEERDAAIRKNSCWELQWYPDTPNGFNRIKASSLPALFAYLRDLED